MKWFRIALPVYWLALIVATHYPQVRLPDEIPQSDKIVHASAFGVLALLFWMFLKSRRPLNAASVWIAALVLIPYAALDEYLQQFVGRQTDLMDWIADLIGIVCVLTVLEVRRRLAVSRAA
ncbi:MAG TPA: VanZ family protein [Kofleriaceae bacterium]|nr:VanZ family protein [Kofleriaceae bacterium]